MRSEIRSPAGWSAIKNAGSVLVLAKRTSLVLECPELKELTQIVLVAKEERKEGEERVVLDSEYR